MVDETKTASSEANNSNTTGSPPVVIKSQSSSDAKPETPKPEPAKTPEPTPQEKPTPQPAPVQANGDSSRKLLEEALEREKKLKDRLENTEMALARKAEEQARLKRIFKPGFKVKGRKYESEAKTRS